MGRVNRIALALGMTALLCGCDGQDPERLATIGKLTLAKLDDATGGGKGKLANGWQAIRGSWGDSTLDSRVALRLRWDKDLAGSDIQVQTVSPGVVRLQGTVTDPALVRRAQDVAQATQGVEKVENALTVQGAPAGP
jgi:hypothetical protein